MEQSVLRSVRALLLIMILAGTVLVTAQAQQEDTQAPELPSNIDVRFVMDVSGSMKRTDPGNLRSEAVPMLAELMPEGAQSGLWTFGRYVNMLVPLEEVDDQWRQQMRDARSEIGSPGQYTHIGRALQTATEDFWPGGDYSNTHVVLLTDGMVDVPQGEAASRKERKRILDEVVARFEEHGAHLHTLALSDEADRPLLEQLAAETGGHHAIARNDSELIRAFLSAFGAASPTEEVPLENNGFSVDDSVDEFTALIFRDEGSESAELVAPSGERVTRDSLPQEARWHRAATYDLVTIPEPETGRWEVDAMVGPDSRIKVVSELRMAMADLPARFFASDVLDLEVAFYEDGDRLTDKDFLGVMDVRAEIRNEEGDRQGTVQLSGGQVPANGVFSGEIATLTKPGRYEVRLIGEGETFQRSQRQEVTLAPPFDTEIQGLGSGGDSRWVFRVMPRDPGLAPDSIQVEARVTDPQGKTRNRVLEPGSGGQNRVMTLTGEHGDGVYQVRLSMQAETQDGRPVSLSTPAFEAQIPRTADTADYQTLASQPQQPVSAPAPEPEPEAEPGSQAPLFNPQPVEKPDKKAQTEAGINWLLWGGATGGLVGLGAVAGGLWWWLRRRRASGAPKKPKEKESAPAPESEVKEAETEEPAMEAELEPEEEQAQEPGPDDGTSLAEAAAAYQAQQGGADDAEEASAAELTEESGEPGSEEDTSASDEALEPEGQDESEVAEEAVPTVEESGAEEPVQEQEEDELVTQAEGDEALGEEVAAGADEEAAEESDEAVPTVGDEDAQEVPEDPGALADQILEENQANEDNADDDEFSLEDFDISEFDDLPDQGEQADSEKPNSEEDDGNR
ncbi:VWA domain-containing protein [Halomonadaceae bacterium KBTZ08]